MRLLLNSSWIALAAGSALAIAPSTWAQTTGDTIVVTGIAVPVEADKVGQTITVISGQMIDDQGYAYVPDVLRQIPSLAVSQSGAPGSVTQVRTRGAEANHTLVLLDGIDISSPDQGETDFSTLLTGDISRIEILRGPQSGLYGSNALAGVVNLISRREVDGRYLGASIEAGSFNTVQLEANAGIGDSDTYAAISANRLTSDGYDISPDQTANGVPAVGVGGTPGDKEGNIVTSVNLRGGAALTDAWSIKGVIRYLESESDADGQTFGLPIPGSTYDDASSTDHEQTVVGASATYDPFNGVWETTLSASYVDETRVNRTTNFFLSAPPIPTPAEFLLIPIDVSAIDSTRTKFGVLSTLRLGVDGFKHFITGFVEREEETYEETLTGRDESRTLNAFGMQYRAEIADQLNLYATVRRDQNDNFKDADTYSLAASWAIPNTGARLHTSYGTGVTNPTFIEQFGFNPGFFIGNAALVPEEAIGWDFGVEQTLFEGALVADLTYFESALEHEINTIFLPPTFTIATPLNNTTESNRSGWELYVTATPIEDISLTGSWSELDATQPSGIEARRPDQQGSLDASWKINGGPVQLNLGVTYNGEMIDTDFATFLPTRLDPYTLVRFGAAWKFSDQVEVYGRVENVLDETHQEVIGYNAAPQAAYVGIRFRDEPSK
ncbi:MAG: TonB-dependent receptor [Hyphomonadaceae bacterium]